MLNSGFILVVTAFTIATVQAQDPKKCCLPEQFTVYKGTSVGSYIEEEKKPLSLYEAQDAAFDYKNMMIGAYINRTFFSGEPFQSFKIVEDMAKKLMWYIDPAQKQCVKSNIDDFPFQCVPDNATYVGRSYFGHNKRLVFDTWTFEMKDYLQTSGVYTLSLEPEECVPIGETFVGTSTAGGITQNMLATGGYSNFQTGISDRDRYFKLPDYCKA